MKLGDYHIGNNAPQSVLAIGPTGAGKSIAMCSYPPPIYDFNMDSRMGSVANYYRARPHLGVNVDTDIEFDPYTDFDDFANKLAEFEHNCPYKTIIIDPVTMLSNLMMSYQIKARGRDSGGKKVGKQIGRIKLNTIEDYGGESSAFAQILDSLDIIKNQQRVNVIVIAHLTIVTYSNIMKPESEPRVEKLILTAGKKVAGQIPIRFDEVYNFTIDAQFGNVDYKVKTYHDGDVFARTSFANVPPEIVWTNQNFYQMVRPYFTEPVMKPPQEILQDKQEVSTPLVTDGSGGEHF